MQNLKSFGPLGPELQAPPYPRTWTLLSPFDFRSMEISKIQIVRIADEKKNYRQQCVIFHPMNYKEK